MQNTKEKQVQKETKRARGAPYMLKRVITNKKRKRKSCGNWKENPKKIHRENTCKKGL